MGRRRRARHDGGRLHRHASPWEGMQRRPPALFKRGAVYPWKNLNKPLFFLYNLFGFGLWLRKIYIYPYEASNPETVSGCVAAAVPACMYSWSLQAPRAVPAKPTDLII